MFSIGGVEVRVSSTTVFTVEDGSGTSLQSLPIGTTTVEVEGIEKEQGVDVFIEALRVEVDDEVADFDDRNLYELEGRLTNITPSTITVLGVLIDAGPGAYDSNPQNEIIDRFDDGEILILEVEYSKNGNDLIADEIDLEENDDD